MINVIHLFFLQFKNGIFHLNNKKKTSMIVLIVLLLFVAFQVSFAEEASGQSARMVGWIIMGLFVTYTFMGSFSNRLPWRMEDMTWLYLIPHPISTIAFASVLWQVMIKGLLWQISAIIGDIIFFISDKPFVNLSGKAVIFILFITVLELWFMAVSCARMRRRTRLILTPVAIVLLGLYVLAIFLSNVASVSFPLWRKIGDFIETVGIVLHGGDSVVIWIAPLLLILLSIWLIQYSVNTLECREKLIKEADFWEHFKNHQFLMTSRQMKTQKSWWGWPRFTGVLSLLWVEVLISKKNRLTHVFQFISFLIYFYYFIVFRQEWLLIGVVVAVFMLLVNSYFSGLVRHMQSGDLLLLPGKLWIKILLLQLSHTLWIVPLLFYVIMLSWWEKIIVLGQISEILAWGGAVYTFMLGVQWMALRKSYSQSVEISVFQYYKYLFSGIVISGAVIGGLSHILPLSMYFLLPLVLMVLGVVTWLYSYRKYESGR